MDIKNRRETIQGYDESLLETLQSDQQKGEPMPLLQKPVPEGAGIFDLVPPDRITVGTAPIWNVFQQRRSRRKFTDEPLTLEELSYLLFTTQGVQRTIRNKEQTPVATFRTAPSAGARHPFETYLVINNVTDLEPGLYRYLPLTHQLVLLNTDPDLRTRSAEACCGQRFAGQCAVAFYWTAIPYRMEWRYTAYAAKFIAIDAGHLCQNLYLAAESIGAGTCGIGAYFKHLADGLVGVDGDDEFVIYIAPVGKVMHREAVTVGADVLSRYAGKYAHETGEESIRPVIRQQNGKLAFEVKERVVFVLTPYSETRFQADDVDIEVRFEMDNGTVRRMIVDQFGEEINFIPATDD